MVTLLQVEDLSVTYRSTITGVQSVDVEVSSGESVALLGANGAGKSTTLRAITGLLGFHGGRIARGRISFDGKDVTGVAPHRLVRSGLGQSLEGRRIFAELTVRENLRVAVLGRKSADDVARALDLFPRLAERMGQPAGTLSGGEQQMLAIGRALLGPRKLIILDEPSLGLAPMMVAEIGSAIEKIRLAGIAVLLVDQSTALATAATSRAYLLENGVTVAEGPTSTLLADDTVRAAYLGAAISVDDLEPVGHR